MFLARVTGTVVATVKDEALRAHKLLVVRPLDASIVGIVDPAANPELVRP